MTPVDPGAQSTAAEKRSGCGVRGCLFGCLLPSVVLGVAVLFALPTLREKWTSFRANNPWVSAVPGVASVLRDAATGMRAGDSVSPDTAAKKPAGRPLKGVNEKEAMPRDLPLWPRARTEAFSAGEGNAAAYQRVTAGPDSILGYFRRAMPAQGWRLDQERKGAGGVLLLYRKPGHIARVEVVPDSAGTDLWLRTRVTEAVARRD
jgi:hypothetical protein